MEPNSFSADHDDHSRVDPTDSRLNLSGVHTLVHEAEAWWRPWRLPRSPQLAASGREFEKSVTFAAGARFRFTTDTAELSLMIDGDQDSSPLDVLVDGRLQDRREVHEGHQRLQFTLPGGEHLVEIWLPQFGQNRFGPLDFVANAKIGAPPRQATRWIAYGSSITQCRAAAGPSDAWPAIVSRNLDWQLTNLGFGGQCHLDPVVARHIRDSPDIDLVLLCVGINIYGQSSFTSRTLEPAIWGFIQTIRDRHPSIPLILVTPITAPKLESAPNAAGMTLSDVRAAVSSAGHQLQRTGDTKLSVIEGPDIFGLEDEHLLGDNVHPNAAGYTVLGERFTKALEAIPVGTLDPVNRLSNGEQ